MKKTFTLLLAMLFTIALIKSQSLVPVGLGIPGTYGVFSGTVAYNNELYASDGSDIYKWDGTNWNALGIVHDDWIMCMEVYNGELYVGGWFQTFNGVAMNRIARYNGTTWQTAGTGVLVPPSTTGGIEKMGVYNGKLIAMGGFIQAGSVSAKSIASWDGISWNSLGLGLSQIASIPEMLVFNNNLYVFSIFDTAGGIPVNNVAMWDGVNWSPVGSGINNWPISATVFDSTIYAGLWISQGYHNSMIVKWDGSSWIDVEQDTANTSWNIVHDLKEFNGCLYATGYIDTIDGIYTNNLARFDGNSWHPIGDGLNNEPVFLTEFNNDLYITGRFTNSGTTLVHNVAKLNSPSFCTTSINETRSPNEIVTIFPNPFTTQTTINFSEPQTKTIIKITDVLGNEIKTINFTGTQYNFEKGEMKAGAYLVQIIDGQKHIFNRKIIIQ